jgi:hypothetical protein
MKNLMIQKYQQLVLTLKEEVVVYSLNIAAQTDKAITTIPITKKNSLRIIEAST